MAKKADDMRMGLLKTQIDAHFIVNTITCIEGLAHQGQNEKAAIMAANLAGMLKSQHQASDEVNVFTQMEDIERYIEIMNIRNGGKFTIDIDVDESLFRCRMLGRVLQPLVENALTHGLGNKKNDCKLAITGKLETDCILFEVADNGKGIAADTLVSLRQTLESDGEWENDKSGLEGVALVNTQGRIRARYGKNYGLTLQNITTGGLSVTARLPVIRDADRI
jgi:two-component system sensor histidine kinase YesM